MSLNAFLLIFSLSILALPSFQSKIVHNRPKILTKFVKDLIENEKVPSTMWMKACWTKIDELNFIKSISIPIQIARPSATKIDLRIDENKNKQWFLIDVKCGEEAVDFLSSTDPKYFAHPFRWIIVDATQDAIQNLTLLPDSNIILANQDEQTEKYILKQGKHLI